MIKSYYTNIMPLFEEELYEKGKKLLPADRLEKLDRIKTKEGRLCSMAAGLLFVYGLRLEGILPQETLVFYNEDGKPFLKQYPSIYYNLSHSGSYAAMVIGDHEVGIDIEKPRCGMQHLVGRFFSEEEKAYLEANFSDEEFTKYWTRKESYIKAVGLGMRMPLQEFSTITDEVNGYFLQSVQLEHDYWLTVCQKEMCPGIVPQEVFLRDMIG